jgi:bacteriorhodopsin
MENPPPIVSKKKHKKVTFSPTVPSYITASFYTTYIILVIAFVVTFCGAIYTSNNEIRHVLLLESLVTFVASYYYSRFTRQIDVFSKNNKYIQWKNITHIRYEDWYITTPLMLVALCLLLSNHTVKLATLLVVVVLDYFMLYAGYLGETGTLDRGVATLLGFIPFAGIFGIVYTRCLRTSPASWFKYTLFTTYFVIWAMYGIVFMLDEEMKNIITNVLDCIAKGGVGIGLLFLLSA